MAKYDEIISYIINLDSSKGRYNYVAPQVEMLGFHMERISAINGSMLSEEELKDTTDFTAFKKIKGFYPTKGIIACDLSHRKTWKRFIESEFKFALIFEDDVRFNPVVLLNIVQELVRNVHLWDIVSFDVRSGFPLSIKTLSNNYKLSVDLRGFPRAGGYLITNFAAKKLLEKAFPIKTRVDDYISRAWQFGLKGTIVTPSVVTQSYGDSDISSVDQNTAITTDSMTIFVLYKLVCKVQYRIIKIFYNLKLYLIAKAIGLMKNR